MWLFGIHSSSHCVQHSAGISLGICMSCLETLKILSSERIQVRRSLSSCSVPSVLTVSRGRIDFAYLLCPPPSIHQQPSTPSVKPLHTALQQFQICTARYRQVLVIPVRAWHPKYQPSVQHQGFSRKGEDVIQQALKGVWPLGCYVAWQGVRRHPINHGWSSI